MRTVHRMKVHRKDIWALTWMIAISCGGAGGVHAQANADAPAEKRIAVTTADSAIHVEHLELVSKPLTKDELVVEADGWRDLLKANVQEIAELRIAINEQQQVAAEAQEAEATTETPNEPSPSEGTSQDIEFTSEQKQNVAVSSSC